MAKEFRYIVRIGVTDINGSMSLDYGLTRIKGIGISFSRALLKAANLSSEIKVGELSDSNVQMIEDALKNPDKYNLPAWFMNRRKDMETGKNLHLTGPDLELRLKSDFDHMMKIKSWRGIRHSLGLKVRGQRTRTTGRKGRSVGVKKRRIIKKRIEERRGGING